MIGQGICKMLTCNDTVEKLNVESNFITSSTMTDLVHEACKSPILTELRIDNQRNKWVFFWLIGNWLDFLVLAKKQNTFSVIVLQKAAVCYKNWAIGNFIFCSMFVHLVSWRCPGPRQRSQVLLMKNQDQARIRRNQAKNN